MPLPHDLLEQAHHLALREPKRPRQASLRRSVSASYYAVFHLLASEGALQLAAKNPANLRIQVRRAFSHGDMKNACVFFTGNAIKDANSGANLLHLLALPLEAELLSVAAKFVELQEARHKADYDHLHQWTRFDALVTLSQAERVFVQWKQVRGEPNANVFLAVLLFHGRWKK